MELLRQRESDSLYIKDIAETIPAVCGLGQLLQLFEPFSNCLWVKIKPY